MVWPDVSVVVVPHERFSASARSLETLIEHTPEPHELVYVDGGSPAAIRRYLEAAAARHGFHLLRTEGYVSPNQARNLGLRHARGRYVVFVDNDALVTPGWLGPLVKCAEETGAWVVGPLQLEGELAGQVVHTIGGIFTTRERDGQRFLEGSMPHHGQRLAEVPGPLVRHATDFVEFHCVLVRRDAIEGLGLLDEKLLSTREHFDLCLSVREAGGTVYVEPASVVTFLPPATYTLSDLPYYLLRWSEAWNRASLEHFQTKWNVRVDPGKLAIMRWRRHLLLRPLARAVRPLIGPRAKRFMRPWTLIAPIELVVNRLLFSKRSAERRAADTTPRSADRGVAR